MIIEIFKIIGFVWVCLSVIKTVLLWFQLTLITKAYVDVFKIREVATKHYVKIAIFIPFGVVLMLPLILLEEKIDFIRLCSREELIERFTDIQKKTR